MSTAVSTVLPVGVGYGVVVGVGFFFAFVMIGVSMIQNRYTKFSTRTSEEFNTASRSVKPGLIAAGIVSAWTWAATLLQSSTVAYEYGVAGPFWYAAGATVQILMFSILACKTKMNAPRTHTYLEIIYNRYGAFKTTGMEYPTLADNLAAIMTGLIVSVVVSLVKPDDFDWEITRAINAEGALEGVTPSGSKSSSLPTLTDGLGDEKRKTAVDAPQPPTERDEERQQSVDVGVEENATKIRSAFKLACVAAFVLPFIMDFLIPIPMFLSHYVFSEHFFIFWVVISFNWVFSSAGISVILPLYETAGFFKELFGEIITDIRRWGRTVAI